MIENVGSRDEEDQPKAFLSSFDRADAKLFLITFAGTVVANVVTVMVVAVAFIMDRPPYGPKRSLPAVLDLLACVTFTILVVGTGVVSMRRVGRIDGPMRLLVQFLWILLASMSATALLLVLLLLGEAAGVK